MSGEDALRAIAARRVGSTIASKYRVDGILGIGGIAVVYAVTHRNQADLALKMLHRTTFNADVQERFLREGSVTRTMRTKTKLAILLTSTLLVFSRAADAMPTGCESAPAVTSAFWARLDSLCAQGGSVTAGPAPGGETEQYCSSKREPGFAALPERTRMATLDTIAGTVGVLPGALGPTRLPMTIDSGAPLLAQLLASKLSGRHPELGAAGDALARKTLAEICKVEEVKTWMPSTCAPFSDKAPFFVQLRQRSLTDGISALVKALRSAAANGQPNREPLVASATALDALQGPADAISVARAFVAKRIEECGDIVDLPPGGGEPSMVAGAILERILKDGLTLDRSEEHYARLVATTLRSAGRLAPGEALSPSRRAATQALLGTLREMRPPTSQVPTTSTTMGAATPTRPPRTLTVARAFATAATQSLTVATDSPIAVPPSYFELIQALADGRMEDVMERGLALGGRDVLPPPVTRAIATSLELAFAVDEREVERIAKRAIAAWIGGLIVDVNIGTPVLESRRLDLAIGATLGWEADRWGARASFDRGVLDTQLSGRDYLEARLSYSAQSWYNFSSLRAPVGFGLGGKLGVEQFYSDLTILDATGTASEELSQLVRGELNLNLWASPSERVFLRTQAAAGIDAEGYSQEVLTVAGPSAGQTKRDRSSAAGDYRLHAMGVWRVVPGWVRTTLVGRLGLLQLSQTKAVYTYDLRTTFSSQNEIVTTTRLDGSVRLAIDAEALQVFDVIRPGVFAELHYIRKDDGNAVIATIVPTVGVGIRTYTPF